MDDYLPIRYMNLLATELIVMILGSLDPRDLLRNLTVSQPHQPTATQCVC